MTAEKRLKIIRNIFSQFDKNIFEGIILIGSMVYDRNYAIRKNSDIDLLFFVKNNNFNKVYNYKYFQGPFICEKGKELFRQGKIYGLWDDFIINGVTFNNGVVNYDYFKKYCRLETPETLRTYFEKKTDPESGSLVQTKGEFRDNIIITSFLVNEIIFDKNGEIKNNLRLLLESINNKYSAGQIEKKIEFILNKVKPKQRRKILQNLFS